MYTYSSQRIINSSFTFHFMNLIQVNFNAYEIAIKTFVAFTFSTLTRVLFISIKNKKNCRGVVLLRSLQLPVALRSADSAAVPSSSSETVEFCSPLMAALSCAADSALGTAFCEILCREQQRILISFGILRV